MKLDTHVHTSPGSRCSVMSIDQYLKAAAQLELQTICVTNHGEMSDYDELLRRAPAGMTVIPGVEISSREGDFIFYSTDLAYLRTLKPAQPLPDRAERPAGCAVVWVHPFAGSPGGRGMGEGYLAEVAGRVDGIEVYNGNWPDEAASRMAGKLASAHDLAELGGSDTHRRKQLFRCWTEVQAEVGGAADLVRAIRERKTRAEKV